MGEKATEKRKRGQIGNQERNKETKNRQGDDIKKNRGRCEGEKGKS